MSRIEPPPLATWILEHCIPGQRDQALTGDLLEAFQQGRSNRWYWRQTLAAFAVGWAKYLGDRAPLIVFALMWSMLAPAWVAIVDRVQNSNLAWPVSVAAWLALNLAFLWTGMLLFAAFHRRVSVALNTKKLKRACAMAAAIFLPAYFVTFILMNLFSWPGIGIDWRLFNPLDEITDFALWAVALRFPYLVTILWSMWRITPALATMPAAVVDWRSGAPSSIEAPPFPTVRRDPRTIARLLLFMIGAGLLNALIAGVLLCRLPEAHHPTLSSVTVRAALYVVIGAIAGVMGTYVYWNYPSSRLREDPPVPFSLFALICAAGWVWIPAMVLFSEQVSAMCAWVAMIASLLLSGEMRRMAYLVFSPHQSLAAAAPAQERPLFAESLYRPPSDPYGFVITFCLYGAGWGFADRSNTTAAVLLALGACVFRLRSTVVPRPHFHEAREYRRAALRLAAIGLPAVLITIWALLDGVAYRNRLAGIDAAGNVTGSNQHGRSHADSKSPAHGGSGYESVVLWPYLPKKRIVAPVEESPLLAPGTHEPAIIRFDGQYWYLQPPDEHPGPRTHQAQGTPLDVHIASSNSFPLIMQAHEFLRSRIRLAHCREIRVKIDDRDNETGFISMAVWLKDSSLAGAPAVYLGQQTIRGPGDAVVTGKSAGTEELLVFAVPAGAKIRSFDEITVVLLPDTGHRQVGPRIAIEQFELVPQ
jgi:hypothetical protein